MSKRPHEKHNLNLYSPRQASCSCSFFACRTCACIIEWHEAPEIAVKAAAPPRYEQIEEVEDGHVLPEAATAAVAVGESQADGVDPAEAARADTVAALPDAVGSDGSENLDSCDRWQLLAKYKTVQALVAAVIREKTDEQLQSLNSYQCDFGRYLSKSGWQSHHDRTVAGERRVHLSFNDCSAERALSALTSCCEETTSCCWAAVTNRFTMRPKDLPAYLLQPGSSQCPDQGSHP